EPGAAGVRRVSVRLHAELGFDDRRLAARLARRVSVLRLAVVRRRSRRAQLCCEYCQAACMSGQLWVEVVGDLIIARVRGEPTEALLRECQEQVLFLVN